MDNNSKKLAEDIFLREPVDARIRKHKDEEKEESHSKLRVEMQTLRLNPDSQKLIMETLRFIHGTDFKLASSSLYKDKGSNLSKRFWMERGNLIVQGGCDYSNIKKPDLLTASHRLRSFALSKLERYNFHANHCAEAFDNSGENVDKTLEILFYKYFNVDPNDKPIVSNMEERNEMRSDEVAVLESIYDTSFSVKEKNVWSVKMELPYLTNLYKTNETIAKKTSIRPNSNQPRDKRKERCKLYLRGPCRYGNKCRFLHEKAETTETNSSQNEIPSESETIMYEIEIRIPEESLYPYQMPLIYFKTLIPNKSIPMLTFLKVTNRLVKEAKNFATEGTPCVYSLAELLQNEEDIIKTIKEDKTKFPDASDILFPQLTNSEPKEELPTHYQKRESRDRSPIGEFDSSVNKENERIARIFRERGRTQRYLDLLASRKKLPAWDSRNVILKAIQNSQVIVISGDTGCGKSTQVPQYILDDWLTNFQKGGRDHIKIVCTQPRRISAIGVAERVAHERMEKTGQVVGYQIRLESKISASTRLLYCTTGMLLRRLGYDPQLKSTTHVIVDEVHERSIDSDFLLLILADLVKVRKDLTVILMSATLNAELFSQYFGNVPMLYIPGRTFPVEQLFLEDIMELTTYILEENGPYARKVKKGDKQLKDVETELETCDLLADANEPPKVTIRDENLTVAQTVARYRSVSKLVCKNLYFMDTEKINLELIEHLLTFLVFGDHGWPKDGSILVFLPGIVEIMALYDQLSDSSVFSPRAGKFVLVPLHSTLSTEEQALLFKKVERGVRKIVLSTNIAETSVTIDDCVFVIDCGRMKEKHFDSNRNMESLELTWVSRANAKQRMGRAGRVMPGVCLHLFTSHRYQYHMLEQPIPEIHRVPLEQLILKIKILPLFDNMTAQQVLEKTVEPPSKQNIEGALSRLQDVGALDTECDLTALGKHLAFLPVDVRIGKLIIFGAIFRCVDSTLTIAACLSHKSPFVSPFGKKQESDAKKKFFAFANSDQLTALRAYRRWQETLKQGAYAASVFAKEHFLSHKTLQMLGDIKHQLLGLLASIGFVPDVPDLRRRARKDTVAALTGVELNENGDNEKILAAILCAALYPNVVKVMTPEKSFHMQAGGAIPRQPSADELKFKTKSDGYVALHPSSINASVGYYPSPYLVYQEKVKTSRIFIRECSVVPKLPFVLFSGCNLSIELHNGTFIVSLEDGWIVFQVETHEIAEMLRTIRVELINLLEEKINDPCLNLLHYEKGNRIIKTIAHVINRD